LSSAAKSNDASNPIRRVVVAQHKVTATELQAMKTKLGVSVEGQDYNNVVDGHGTGLRAPTASEWQQIGQTVETVDSITYVGSPPTVDNSQLPYFPPIGNQGSEGSCVAWSVGYYVKTFQEAKEHGWDLSGASWIGTNPGYPTVSNQDKIMSPEFVYHLINSGVDNGASFNDAIDLVCSIGVSSWLKMPYSQTDHTTWPSEQAWTEAPLYRGNSSSFQYLSTTTDAGINSLKNWLASSNLATIGVDSGTYSNLTSSDLWTLDNYMNPDVDHANTIVGYDDSLTFNESGVTHQGAFKVANSWGKGIYAWEHIPDGFYWISYEAMKQRVGYCMIFSDLIGYQPELMASFKITHPYRGECDITIGAGNVNSSLTTKWFNQYVSGGNVAFPANNIVLDITEFKNYVHPLYNQSYFLKVRDSGSSSTGIVNGFAIGSIYSADAPKATVQNSNVNLTVAYTVYIGELALSSTSGPPGGAITLNGWGFTHGSSANLTYLNSATSTWISIANNTAISTQGQFTYSLNAPDLLQSNLAGDNVAGFDSIVFRAVDNANGISCNASLPYTEWRRGLTKVGNAEATGVYGNGTSLTSIVAVETGQTLQIEGKWFSPGDVAILWDGSTSLVAAVANDTGYFTTNLIVPTSAAGRHEIVLRNGNVDFLVSVARITSTSNDYTGQWHNSDFKINLTPDSNNCQTYYKINGGAVRVVAVNGQPLITTEGGNNVLEYWSVDEFGNEELPHKTLTSIQLDKTPPSGSFLINYGERYTNSVSVTLALNASDSLSGVKQLRFSNDGVWDTETWETPSSGIRVWMLASGDGEKTVYYQIVDNAELTSSYSASITLDTTKPTVNAGQNQTAPTGSTVAFDADGSQDNTGISTYTWSFGDGSNATGRTATHTYSTTGNYTAMLTVQDLAGNTASSSLTITVQNSIGIIPEFPAAVLMLPVLLGVMLLCFVAKKKSSSKK
jgi:hypothetical protein